MAPRSAHRPSRTPQPSAIQVRPTSDLAFKKLLGSENHKRVTAGFIHDFFGLDVEPGEIRFADPYSIEAFTPPDGLDDVDRWRWLREIRRDVTIDLDTVDVTIEMQVWHHRSFVRRALLYATELYGRRYDATAAEPDRYRLLRPVWALNVVDHTLFPEDEYAVRMFSLHDADHGLGLEPELLRFGFLELPKALPEDGGDRRAAWRQFLRTGRAAASDPDYLHEAATIIERISLDPQEVAVITAAEKFDADWASALHSARLEGEERGEARGETRGKELALRETARAALAQGLDPTLVAQITGLGVQEMEALDERRPRTNRP